MSHNPRPPLLTSLILFFAVFLLLFQSECTHTKENQVIQNLRAFTKLYGYIRYFHPSDEASQIDWDKFAILGVEKAKSAADYQELRSTLEELFLPLAPTIHIYHEGEEPVNPMNHIPEDTTGLKVAAWQHKGLGYGYTNTPYVSIRLNRRNILRSRMPGVLTQGISATNLRGQEIRLSAMVKAAVEGPGNQGHLWLRVDRENQQRGFFDNMNDRPILSNEWKRYEIRGRVDDDARMIFFGCMMSGAGKLWLDDFKLQTLSDDGWKSVEIENSGFEEGESGQRPKKWMAQYSGYMVKIQDQDAPAEKKCLLIESVSQEISGPLFEKRPDVSELINKKLCKDLYTQIPLALYSDEKGTLGINEENAFGILAAELDARDFKDLTANNEFVRLADVVIAWNVFQHFYPYFDIVGVDWDEELNLALESALSDVSERDFYYTLSRLVAKLQDGHGNVYHRIWMEQAGLPAKVDWIENQVVVTVSKDQTLFQMGDIILALDGRKAEKVLLEAETYISGSPQWKRWKSLNRFGYGVPGTLATIELKRGNQVLEVEAERNFKQQITEMDQPKMQVLEGGVHYVDLSRASWNEIKAKIHDLVQAKGVIFDLRGYPNGNHEVLCHLLKENDTSDAWMQIPLIIYPDQENIVGYQKMGWNLVAKQPHIGGNVAFITDGRAISYAESVMSFVEHYKLAEIVGRPTAGVNGNVNSFALPGDFQVTWTGMKVFKHDGSQHHLIGIRPTVPAVRTVRGVIDGRDELLEKAIEVVSQ
jgi:C-terminal processing protease CtpA/Prc